MDALYDLEYEIRNKFGLAEVSWQDAIEPDPIVLDWNGFYGSNFENVEIPIIPLHAEPGVLRNAWEFGRVSIRIAILFGFIWTISLRFVDDVKDIK